MDFRGQAFYFDPCHISGHSWASEIIGVCLPPGLKKEQWSGLKVYTAKGCFYSFSRVWWSHSVDWTTPHNDRFIH